MNTLNNITIENFTRINNDVNGNPRYICHFLDLLTDNEKQYKGFEDIGPTTIELQYNLAVKKAKKIGGKKYRGKYYGGGIVFQSYNINHLISLINELNK